MEAHLWEQALPFAYSPAQADRKRAEDVIEQYLHQPNALGSLLQLVHEHGARDVRQAGGAVFKNRVKHFWMDEEDNADKILISYEEKEHVKALVMEVLFEERDKSIRDLLAEGVRAIADVDFPSQWPMLLPLLLQNIQSNDPTRMQNALVTLRKIAKRYEYKGKENRGPLNFLVQTCFPILQQLFEHLVSNNSLEAAVIMKLIAKIFWSATQHSLPDATGVDVFKFFDLFALIIDKPLPEAHENLEPYGQPSTPEERSSWPWWKLKKWVMQVAARFIQRYGNPRYVDEEYKEFAEHFRSQTSLVLLGPVMNSIARTSQGQFCTDRVTQLSLSFISTAVEMSPTYKAMKPHVQTLVTHAIFPLLCLTDYDLWLFDNDAPEFIRKSYDTMAEFLDPKLAATSLLSNLARYRGRDTLMPILGFLNEVLIEYQSASPNQRDYRSKDGALMAVCAMYEVLKNKPDLKPQLEEFVVAHILPEFTSPMGILRARACWTMTYFADFSYTDPTIMNTIAHGVLQALRDPSLVVQTNAATALRYLLDAENIDHIILPILPEIINEFFRIMSEIENDVTVAALHVLVYRYGDHVGPLAAAIVQRLADSFLHLSAIGAEDDEAAFAATTCLDTVATIMDACAEDRAILAQLEEAVMPVLISLLQQDDCFDYIENVIELLSYLTYHAENISTNLWILFGPLVQALDRYAYDFIREMLIPLDNYISKDPATFLQYHVEGRPAVEILLEIVKKTMDNDQELERDARAAMRLLMCILHSCHGGIDVYIPAICALLIEKSMLVKKEKTRLVMMDIVMSLIFYNPMTALECFAQVSENMFSAIFVAIPLMETTISQRLIVLSFSSLMLIPSELLPNAVRVNLGNIMSTLVREMSLILKDDEEEQQEEGGEQDDDDEEEGDDEEAEDDEEYDEDELEAAKADVMIQHQGGFHEDDDAVDPEEATYHKAVDKLEKIDKQKVIKYMAGEPVDDDEDEKEEEVSFTSPIENRDCVQFFFRSLNEAIAREPQVFGILEGTLPAEDQVRLQILVQHVAGLQQSSA